MLRRENKFGLPHEFACHFCSRAYVLYIECEPIASCKLAVLDQLHPVDTHYADQSHSVDLYSAKTGCDWSICEITTTNLQSSSFGGLQKKPEIRKKTSNVVISIRRIRL